MLMSITQTTDRSSLAIYNVLDDFSSLKEFSILYFDELNEAIENFFWSLISDVR